MQNERVLWLQEAQVEGETGQHKEEKSPNGCYAARTQKARRAFTSLLGGKAARAGGRTEGFVFFPSASTHSTRWDGSLLLGRFLLHSYATRKTERCQ